MKSNLSFRHKYFVQKSFQSKYTGYLVLCAFISAVIIGGPSYYFLNQNYAIFIDLAYANSPELIQHLQREQSWVNAFLFAALLSLVVVQVYLGLRLTFRIVGPLLALQKHMKTVTKGNLTVEPLNIRTADEFHTLVETYNYLYKTLQAQNIQDVKFLNKIKQSIQDKDTLDTVNNLIHEKTIQVIGSSSSTALKNGSSRAS